MMKYRGKKVQVKFNLMYFVCFLSISLPPTWRSPHRGTDTHQGTELLQEHH